MVGSSWVSGEEEGGVRSWSWSREKNACHRIFLSGQWIVVVKLEIVVVKIVVDVVVVKNVVDVVVKMAVDARSRPAQ